MPKAYTLLLVINEKGIYYREPFTTEYTVRWLTASPPAALRRCPKSMRAKVAKTDER